MNNEDANIMKTATLLGFKHLDIVSQGSAATQATVSLDSQPKNFRFIYITHGYYESGFPSYSSAIIPVAILDYAIETFFTTGGKPHSNSWETLEIAKFAKTATSIKVTVQQTYLVGATNCYVAVYGIK